MDHTAQPPRICDYCQREFAIEWWMHPGQTVCSPQCQFDLKQEFIARKVKGQKARPTPRERMDQMIEASLTRQQTRRVKAVIKRLPGISTALALWLADDC